MRKKCCWEAKETGRHSVYLLYWYKSTNTGAAKAVQLGSKGNSCSVGTQCTCFTGTKVRILTQQALNGGMAGRGANSRRRMLAYADVCWRTITYADVCWRMLTYAGRNGWTWCQLQQILQARREGGKGIGTETLFRYAWSKPQSKAKNTSFHSESWTRQV
jgi:hypothetical protein